VVAELERGAFRGISRVKNHVRKAERIIHFSERDTSGQIWTFQGRPFAVNGVNPDKFFRAVVLESLAGRDGVSTKRPGRFTEGEPKSVSRLSRRLAAAKRRR
jgi:hypothetical protein